MENLNIDLNMLLSEITVGDFVYMMTRLMATCIGFSCFCFFWFFWGVKGLLCMGKSFMELSDRIMENIKKRRQKKVENRNTKPVENSNV